MESNNYLLRQILFLVMLVGMSAVLAYELSFFLSSFLGAVTLNVLLQPTQGFLTNKRGINPHLSATLLLLAIVLVFTGFFWLLFHLVLTRVSAVDFSLFTNGADAISSKLDEMLGYNVIPKDLPSRLSVVVGNAASDILNTTYSVVANLVMMFFFLYFMLVSDNGYIKTCFGFLPLSKENIEELKNESRAMVYSNSIGIPFMMILQGIFAWVGYMIMGVSDPIFWGFITGLFSIIPIVGTTVIWIPLAAYLLITGNTYSGIGLLAYGGLIITNVDNLFRFMLMKKIADVHPMVTILGVILGVPMFGFWGIVFGPSLLSIFLLLIKTYQKEYLERY